MIQPINAAARQGFLESHPSLNASMEDYEAREFSPTMPDIPSQHSGFRSHRGNTVDSSYSESSSRRSSSPPAWRKHGSGWFKHQQSISPNRSGFMSGSRECSPQYIKEEEEDADGMTWTTAARIPLPASPEKGRSPDPSPEPEAKRKTYGRHDRESRILDAREQSPDAHEAAPSADGPHKVNYIRFQTSLDVIQRTEPIEDAVQSVRAAYRHVTKSRYSMLLYIVGSILSYWMITNILSPPTMGPTPDLLTVASMAKRFDRSIGYSEEGHAQIEQLQESGVAVWDLGESLRSTNMTSAPIIVRQLDELSESLKTLAIELTRFFTGVDSDVDSILLVMEWAQRELTTITSTPASRLNNIWSNTHAILTRTGIIRDSQFLRDLMGQTHAQRTRSILERTFREFVSVLEESINNELTYSIQLFGLFEAIDKQFLNLQRSAIREQDQQERMENDFLGSLWTKVIGADMHRLRKYEKNRSLLQSVRDRTLFNKQVLGDHNRRLLQLKVNLEVLRKDLVRPLLKNETTSTQSVEGLIKGLEGTYFELRDRREEQKKKMMEAVYGAGNRRTTATALNGPGNGRAIEGSPR